MAIIQPPLALENVVYNAAHLRRAFGALIANSGVSGANSMKVSAAAPAGMNVLVNTGHAWINTGNNSGYYHGYNDAPVSVSVAAAHATLPRIDIVIAAVNDSTISGSANDWYLKVETGTPASSPSAPATPNRAIVLARVLVPAAATAVIADNITDTRQFVAPNGNMIICLSTTRPSTPFLGQQCYEVDTQITRQWKGTRWVPVTLETSHAAYLERGTQNWGFTDGWMWGFNAPGTGSSANEDTSMYTVAVGTANTQAESASITVTETGRYKIQAAAATDSPGIGYYAKIGFTFENVTLSAQDAHRMTFDDGRTSATGGFMDLVRTEEVWLTAGAKVRVRLSMNTDQGTIRKAHFFVQRLAG